MVAMALVPSAVSVVRPAAVPLAFVAVLVAVLVAVMVAVPFVDALDGFR